MVKTGAAVRARQVRLETKKVRFMVKKLQAISSKEQHFWLAAYSLAQDTFINKLQDSSVNESRLFFRV
jgi:hypothetical protein